MEAERKQFVERNIACRPSCGSSGRKRERVVICPFTLFLRANDATRPERVRYHGISAEGYRQPTASPYQKAAGIEIWLRLKAPGVNFVNRKGDPRGKTRVFPGNGELVDAPSCTATSWSTVTVGNAIKIAT